MRVTCAWLLLPALLILSACADDDPGPGATCEMQTVAVMPVLNDRGIPIIKASINGTPVAFVVDTGARGSVIFGAAAAELGLPSSSNTSDVVEGIGGSVFSHLVTIRRLSLGTAAIRDVDLDSVPGFATRPVDGLPLVGLFGGDFLANYSVYFDLPSHLVALFHEHHCSDNLRPWPTGAFYRLPFDLQNDTAIMVDIAVDGHPLKAQLDSGASRTILDSASGRAGGAVRKTMTADRLLHAQGIDGNDVEVRVHRFDSLDIGPEHFAPAYLPVADLLSSALIGVDFMRDRRVWISYAHEKIYVQRVLFPKHRQGAPTLPPTPAAHPGAMTTRHGPGH